MSIIRGFSLIILSSLLVPLALPNEIFVYGNPALGIVALVPLYLGLVSIQNHGIAALSLAVYGAIVHCLSSYWLWFFKGFAMWTLGSTTIGYAVVYAAVGGWLSWGMKKAGVMRPFIFALGWTVFEFTKSIGFLGYPWGLLAYTWNTVDILNQIADRTGVYGITFILAYANATLAELAYFSLVPPGLPSGNRLTGRNPIAAALLRVFPDNPMTGFVTRSPAARQLAVAALVMALALGYGRIRLATPIPEKGRMTAVLVQQNSDTWESNEQSVLKECIRLTRDAIRSGGRSPDIVIWNETNLDWPYMDYPKRYNSIPAGDPLVPFIKSTAVHFLFGAPVILDYKDFKATNSALFIGPDGQQITSYAKSHPVPFAESIPLMEYGWFRNFMANVVGLSGGWEMGDEYTVFKLPTGDGVLNIGTPICFEDAFAGVCRGFFANGADILVNITNDTWSKTVSAEVQHFVAARYRAIEHRKTLVRSTNGGVSGVVDAYGRLGSALPLFTPASIFTEVPVYAPTVPTLYAISGDWFALSCLVLCAVLAVLFIASDMIGYRDSGAPRQGQARSVRDVEKKSGF
ncbi:MAG: apolipoprotein N-acyltransferase [Spirochaetes bacterium]|nr:apolipoprotein N-acyltransferase [Spirochaetota bacterium]